MLKIKNRKRKSYPNEILPGKLYLGDQFDANDINVLRNLKITHVVNVTSEIPNYFEKNGNAKVKSLGISYMRILVEDKKESMIHYYFPRVYGYIDSALLSNGNLCKKSLKKEHIIEELCKQTRTKVGSKKLTQNSFIHGITSLMQSNNTAPQNKSIEEIYEEFSLLMKEHSDNTNRVLIHCAMGISRSSSIVIMYLMKKFNITFESVRFID